MRQRFVAVVAILLAFAVSAIAAQAEPFGAIATSAGAWGQAHNQSTLARAEAGSLVMCRSRERGACGVRVWWAGAGECGALAQNPHTLRWGWGYARGIAAARANALMGAYGGVILVVACNN